MNYYSLSAGAASKLAAAIAIWGLLLTASQGLFLSYVSADHTADPINTADTAYNDQTNVDICHTGNGTNFTTNSPNVDSIVDGGNSGHGGAQHENDVIPAFYYQSDSGVQLFHGKNWSPEGELRWQQDCSDGVITISDVDLAITKSADDDTPDEGQTVIYTLEVTNNGTTDATNVVVTDTLPAGTTFVSANPTEDDSNPLTWNLDGLASGASTQITVTVTVDSATAGDTITNEANVSATETDTNPGDNSVTEDIVVNTPVSMPGCTDPAAKNFDSAATVDDGSCVYPTATVTLSKTFAWGSSTPIYDAGDFTFYLEGTEVDLDVATTVAPGTYTISEDGPVAEFDLGIVCSGGTLAGSDLTVADGDAVACTLTNTYLTTPVTTGTLVVEKAVTAGSDTTTAFDFTGSLGSFSLTAGQSTSSEVVAANGPFSVSETATSGWTLNSAVCVYGDQSTSTPASIAMKAGETVTCTFTNDEDDSGPTGPGTLQIIKQVVGSNITPDQFTYDVIENSVTTVIDNAAFAASGTMSHQLNTGVFDVVENAAVDFTTTYSNSENGNPNCNNLTVTSGATTTCTITNTFAATTTYLVFGYVWQDDNENDNWDGMEAFLNDQGEESESSLAGWTVTANNGNVTYSTTTDENGYYAFNLPAGTWTISESLQEGYEMTFPNGGSHEVEVAAEVSAAPATSLLATVMNYLLPTAHAQAAPVFGPFNFGNVPADGGGGGGGGGGNSIHPTCDLFTGALSGSDIILTWETTDGRDLEIASNGATVFSTSDLSEIENGSVTLPYSGNDYELTVSSFGHDDTCPAALVAGASTSNNAAGPIPQVLGEQVSLLPAGAPNAGAGGASPAGLPWQWPAFLLTLCVAILGATRTDVRVR